MVPRWWKQSGPFFEVRLYDARWGPGEAPELGRMTVGVDGMNCYNPHTGQTGAEVFESLAADGWGPLIYDFAALIATNEYGMPLVSDRFTVSKEAKGVWDYYDEHRYDVSRADVSSGSWRCDPISELAPEWGIRMPIYNFSEYWNVDGLAWLQNKPWKAWQRARKRKKRARKNPLPKGMPTEEEAREFILCQLREVHNRHLRQPGSRSKPKGMLYGHGVGQRVKIEYLGPRKEKRPRGALDDYGQAFKITFERQGKDAYWVVYACRWRGRLRQDVATTPLGYWGPVPHLELLSWEAEENR